MKRIVLIALLSFLITPAEAADQGYVPTTWPTLARALWHFDAVDPANTAAVDMMLRLTECPIVQKHATNDFAWNDIRAGMRQTISAQKATWPRQVKFMQQIELLPYDFQSYAFPIAPETDWHNVTRMQIAANPVRDENICLRDVPASDLRLFPSAASVKLDRPFTLDKVGVLKEVAELYVAQFPPNGKTRRAYVTFYLTLDGVRGVQENAKESQYPFMVEFNGRIDRFEVTADQDGKKPLFAPAQPPKHSGH